MQHQVAARIEQLMESFILDLFDSSSSVSIKLLRPSSSILLPDTHPSPSTSPDTVSKRYLRPHSATSLAKTLQVLSLVYLLLRTNNRMNQRQVFYTLIDSFNSQQDLNQHILDASAALGVPRCMMNIDASTRGLVAGCLKIKTTASPFVVDCEAVGTSGWPIPGDLYQVLSCQFTSCASYIIGNFFPSPSLLPFPPLP